jgi:hypothetical protein
VCGLYRHGGEEGLGFRVTGTGKEGEVVERVVKRLGRGGRFDDWQSRQLRHDSDDCGVVCR